MNLHYELANYIIEAYEWWVIFFSGLSKEFIANTLIYSAGVIWGIELIPQLRKTMQLKNVDGISLAFFSMCLFSYVIYMIGNVLLNNMNIVIAHIPSLIFNTAMICLIIKYRKK